MNSDQAREVGRMLSVSLGGPELTPRERALLARVRPAGVVLFARNCQAPRQVRALTDEVRGLLGADALIAIDQEGGTVDRLRALFTATPSAEAVGAEGEKAARRLGAATAKALRLLGFTLNFAPVLDLARGAARNGLESRAFGADARAVAACGAAYLGALQEGGVLGCVKHFPGLGAAEVDPHEDFPVVTAGKSELEGHDLAPFRALIAVGLVRMVMVAHAAYPCWQGRGEGERPVPASLSREVVAGLLRGRLGFAGVAVTDDLSMGAVTKAAGGLASAARRAIDAGQDLLLVCAGPEEIAEVHASLWAAASRGEIGPERVGRSLARLARLREEIAPPSSFDEGQLDTATRDIARLRDDLGPAPEAPEA